MTVTAARRARIIEDLPGGPWGEQRGGPQVYQSALIRGTPPGSRRLIRGSSGDHHGATCPSSSRRRSPHQGPARADRLRCRHLSRHPGGRVARAKRTDRADARRRHRARYLAETAPDDPGAEGSTAAVSTSETAVTP